VFELRGPEFLVLFMGFAAVVYFTVGALIATREARLSSEPRIRDPYAIAYLRGDTRELLRVVALSLSLRGLLNIGKTTFLTVDETEIERVQIPLEKEVLLLCRTYCAPPALAVAPSIRELVDIYRRELISRGLLAAADVKRARWPAVLVGIAVLVTIALVKIVVAIETGHSNIVFLLVLLAVSIFALSSRIGARRTLAGNTVLGNLRVLFGSLRSRRSLLQAAAGPEATLLAAVFGIYRVPGLDAISWNKLFPTPGSSNSSGCGSGGSGCGGGGGGGGGGCGGCGS
jgi:uncharacterized protein (TIGR04222 family)